MVDWNQTEEETLQRIQQLKAYKEELNQIIDRLDDIARDLRHGNKSVVDLRTSIDEHILKCRLHLMQLRGE